MQHRVILLLVGIMAICIELLLLNPLDAQYRQIDQGIGGKTTAQVWLIKICDSAGANCGTFAIPVTGTVTATPTGTQAVSGTVSVGSATMPALTFTSGTVNLITMPALTFTSGSVTNTVTVSPTGTTTITGTVSATSGTIGQITMPSLTVTSATINTGTVQANAGTGTFAINKAQVLGAALSTANPDISGGRSSTDTVTTAANGAVIAQRLSKFGDAVITLAPPDLYGTKFTAVTTTTANTLLAAPGAAYKWQVYGWCVSNTSATLAATASLFETGSTIGFHTWVQTTSAPGESRSQCFVFPIPYTSTAANTAIQGQVTASAASTTIGYVVFAAKTNS